MKRLSLYLLLFLALTVSAVSTARAQPNPDISWIYGIWDGGIEITDKVRNTYETVIVNFRINEGGNTLTFQYRGCNAQWVLESNGEKEAVFRERIILDKKMPKPSKDSNRCRDGGAIVFYPLTDRYGTTRLGFRYYLPGDTIDEAKYNNRGFLSPSVPYRDSEDFNKYYAVKVGNYFIDRSAIRTVMEFGIKIADVPFSSKKLESTKDYDTSFFYPIVVAVQEGGPAFYGGIAPGDILVSLGERWSLSDSASFIKTVETNGPRLAASLLGVYYDVTDSPYVQSKYLNIAYADADYKSRWISGVPIHTRAARKLLPGIQEANDRAKADYVAASRQIVNEIKARPCGTDSSRIVTMASRLDALAVKSGDYGENQNRRKLILDATAAVCEGSRDGGLSRIETLVLATALKRVDPCDYSPQTNLSSVFDDLELLRHHSRKGYEAVFDSELGTLYHSDIIGLRVSQRGCLNKILKEALN